VDLFSRSQEEKVYSQDPANFSSVPEDFSPLFSSKPQVKGTRRKSMQGKTGFPKTGKDKISYPLFFLPDFLLKR